MLCFWHLRFRSGVSRTGKDLHLRNDLAGAEMRGFVRSRKSFRGCLIPVWTFWRIDLQKCSAGAGYVGKWRALPGGLALRSVALFGDVHRDRRNLFVWQVFVSWHVGVGNSEFGDAGEGEAEFGR